MAIDILHTLAIGFITLQLIILSKRVIELIRDVNAIKKKLKDDEKRRSL